MNPKFFIVTPPWQHSSAGIVALHCLADALNRLGHEARLIFMKPDLAGRPSLQFSTLDADHGSRFANIPRGAPAGHAREARDHARAGVVIYPEIVQGNPLGAHRVVRYMLNREGFITGKPMHAGPTDFILAFWKKYHPAPHHVLPQVHLEPFFNADGTRPFHERTEDLTWFGKGESHGECAVIEGSRQITRQWPATRAELAAQLRRTRYLFTWDALSALNGEALLCGAVPVYLRFKPYTREEILGSELVLDAQPRLVLRGDRMEVSANEELVLAGQARAWAVVRDAVDGFDRGVGEFAEKVGRHFPPGTKN